MSRIGGAFAAGEALLDRIVGEARAYGQGESLGPSRQAATPLPRNGIPVRRKVCDGGRLFQGAHRSCSGVGPFARIPRGGAGATRRSRRSPTDLETTQGDQPRLFLRGACRPTTFQGSGRRSPDKGRARKGWTAMNRGHRQSRSTAFGASRHVALPRNSGSFRSGADIQRAALTVLDL